MKTISLSFTLLSFLAPLACGIDLTPHYITTQSDGVVTNRPYFVDGNHKYAVKLDTETKLSEAEGGAFFRFEKFPDAMMKLRQSPIKADVAFTPETIKRYQDAARSLLPAGAENLQLVESMANPLPINNWQSYRFTFSYTMSGENRRQSITFLNLKPDEQVVMQTAAAERDFDEVTARAWNIIRRWHELRPQNEQPFN